MFRRRHCAKIEGEAAHAGARGAGAATDVIRRHPHSKRARVLINLCVASYVRRMRTSAWDKWAVGSSHAICAPAVCVRFTGTAHKVIS